MATKRESILAAVRTALTGTTGVSTRIYRSRVEPIARAEGSSIVVEPVSDQADQNTSLPTLDWSLTVRVMVFVRGATPDQIADPIVESLHSKLLADQSLGGLCMDIMPQVVNFTMVEGDQPIGVISCDYLIKYRTSVKNLAN